MAKNWDAMFQKNISEMFSTLNFYGLYSYFKHTVSKIQGIVYHNKPLCPKSRPRQ